MPVRKSILLAFAAAMAVSGCFSPQSGKGRGMVSRLPVYAGPRARIAVADFETAASRQGDPAAAGLRRMLLSGLAGSGRFVIIEGAKDPAKSPDLVVTAVVAQFEPQASGGSGGVGGGGGIGSGLLGGLLGAPLNKAYLTLDIRIVEPASSRVLAEGRVQGQASDMAGGSGVLFGGWTLGPGLEAYANTPMDKAIRICLVEAIRYISQNTPQEYYRY